MPSSCRFQVGMLLTEQKCACGKLRFLGAALQPARLSRQKLNPGQGRRAHSRITVSVSSHPPPSPSNRSSFIKGTLKHLKIFLLFSLKHDSVALEGFLWHSFCSVWCCVWFIKNSFPHFKEWFNTVWKLQLVEGQSERVGCILQYVCIYIYLYLYLYTHTQRIV